MLKFEKLEIQLDECHLASENWYKIKDCNYEVSEFGRIRHINTKKIKHSVISPHTGMVVANLYIPKKKKVLNLALQYVVLKSIISDDLIEWLYEQLGIEDESENWTDYFWIKHKDGNLQNNYIANLDIVPNGYNSKEEWFNELDDAQEPDKQLKYVKPKLPENVIAINF